MAGACARRSSRVDQHTLLKEDMNHKTKVNTEKMRLQEHIAAPQSKSSTFATDHMAADAGRAHDSASAQPTAGAALNLYGIDMHANDIESQALAAQTLCEICFEEVDGATASDLNSVLRTMSRLDALLKAIYRNSLLVQQSADSIAHLVREGGAA